MPAAAAVVVGATPLTSRVVVFLARSVAVTRSWPVQAAVSGQRRASGLPATGSHSRQDLSGIWYSSLSPLGSGEASRTVQRMTSSPWARAAGGGTVTVTSGAWVSTTTTNAGASLVTSAGVALPPLSTVTMVNQYSPSCGALKPKCVCVGGAVSLQAHGSLPLLTYSCTSRSFCRSVSPRSIFRRNCCRLVYCILAAGAPAGGWASANNGTRTKDERSTTRRAPFALAQGFSPFKPLPLSFRTLRAWSFPFMIPLPLFGQPARAHPSGREPTRSRSHGSPATTGPAAAAAASARPAR